MDFSVLAGSLGDVFVPIALMTVFLGVALGLVFGAMPGLNQGVLMAITLPFTVAMDSVLAQYLLIGMYVGGVSGGLATGVILGIPGTPASIMTTFDGHALAKQGKAARALALGITASTIGGLVSWAVLATVAEPLARAAVRFSQFEIAAAVFGGLLLIAVAAKGDTIKGLLAGALGLTVSLVGLDLVTSEARFTFGFESLQKGFDLFPVLMGIFAIGGVLVEIVGRDIAINQVRTSVRDVIGAIGSVGRHWVNALRSSLIGTWIGMLPGAGANIGAIIAYVTTQNLDPKPETFGSGREEGVVASEAGNNATIGGSFVPMLALGIPGSPADVFLMAALIFHGINVGPLLIYEAPEIFYGVISGYLVATLIMFLLLTSICVQLARIADLPKHILVPVILVFTTVGTYSLNNNMFDVWVMMAFGIVGLLMTWLKIPTAPFVIGLVLGPQFETSLRSALMQSDGSFLPFILRPVSCAILVGSILFAFWPVFSRLIRRRRQDTVEQK